MPGSNRAGGGIWIAYRLKALMLRTSGHGQHILNDLCAGPVRDIREPPPTWP